MKGLRPNSHMLFSLFLFWFSFQNNEFMILGFAFAPSTTSLMTNTRYLPIKTSSTREPESIGKNDQPSSELKRIVSDYVPREYNAPLWASNCHVNTILGSGEVQRRFLNFQHTVPDYTRKVWETPCGDLTAIDYLPADRPTDRTVVVLHGLESSSDAPLPSKMALAYQRAGFNVAVKLFRGCGGLENRTPRAYHVGFTEDLDFVLRKLKEESDYSKQSFYLSGFSLGGNVICKYLGEIGHKAEDMGILGAAVTCVPFDCVGCQKKLDGRAFSRIVYSKNFLKTLIPKAEEYLERFPGTIDLDLERIKSVQTIGEFDDLFIAQIFGFDNYVDYYTKSSSKQYLKGVKVPLFALNARDDPFIEESTLPTEDDLENAPVHLYYTKKGGHCGFLHNDYNGSPDRCWLADELANFISHVDQAYTLEAVSLAERFLEYVNVDNN
mmetsp:Transcript_34884/g.44490  ORF Transcript_34884/g.44490 Transcript_34884/m.44490 type:complete len:438 (-) Transcript_34884:228-1541(-)